MKDSEMNAITMITLKRFSFFVFLLFSVPMCAFSQPVFVQAKSIGSAGNDVGYSIAVDGSGNSYVIGTFGVAGDFDPGAGTATLTPVGGTDIFFAKYDPSGNYLWAKSIGSSNNDEGWGITVDGSGNVYITGYFDATADFDPGAGIVNLVSVGLGDVFFAKYDLNGNYVWAKNFGSSTDNDFGRDIAVDASGNVYITGWFSGLSADFDPGAGTDNHSPAGWTDIYFAKYDANGNYVWAKTIGTMQFDYGSGIVVDAAGNVYISGFFTNGPADFDPGAGVANLTAVNAQDGFFAKYDSNGNYIWAKKIGTSGNDWARSIAADAGGNVLVSGYFGGGTGDFDPGAGVANLTSVGGEDIFFAKYDSNGNYIWAKNVGGTSNDEGRDMAIDGSGNVYITGDFIGTADFDPNAGIVNLSTGGSDDIFIAKYDANGNYVCAGKLGGTAGDRGWSIAVDASSNIYTTGYFTGASNADFDPGTGVYLIPFVNPSWEVYVAKYTACSTILPVEMLYFSAACEDDHVKLAWKTATEINNDHFTIERSTDGKMFEGIGIVKGAGNSSSIRDYAFIDTRSSSSFGEEFGVRYYRLLQTDQDGRQEYFGPVSVDASTCGGNTVNIFPNVSDGNFTITGSVEVAEIKVYDLSGREVYSVKRLSLPHLLYLGSCSPGVYLVQITTAAETMTKKIIIH